MIPLITPRRWARKPHELHPEILAAAGQIVLDVAQRGDAAVMDHTLRYDGVESVSLQVPSTALQSAFDAADPELLRIIADAADNIRRFHTHQKSSTWYIDEGDGVRLGQRVIPAERAGLYAPGGAAAYPSSVLMTAIPAQVAGVKQIFLASPPQNGGLPHPVVLATARFLGLTQVYAIGGAQAVAAFAFGTESVRKVDVIAGPGNAYVTAAKKIVYGQVGIDSLAGPSEVVILADDSANAVWIAHDLCAQAEHDVLASAVLVTSSRALAAEVCEQVLDLVQTLPRAAILNRSLREHGACIVTGSLEESIQMVNRIAPEHLELMVQDPWSVLEHIDHAGAVFVGGMSPESVGDYYAGPNHVLPTSGTARFASALGVDDFVRRQSVIGYTRKRLASTAADIAAFARSESLEAHARSVEVRLECP
ncbi:MAG: histidinol dehydrogenase [Bacteroidota bacterium]|nr:histidinol dehydrogenase [Bacteroidota bacterium]